MLMLSLHDVRLEFLAEGGANVVYRIHPPDLDSEPSTAADSQFEYNDYDSDTPQPSEMPPLQFEPGLQGKLLRLRKDLPHVTSVEKSQKHFEYIFRPRFLKENLIEPELVGISSELMKDCNSTLREIEKDGMRPVTRRGVYLNETERYGSLITDMSLLADDTCFCFEFKPKWLVQSPAAPVGASRCRTCALGAMRMASSKDHSGTHEVGPCPLNLISLDKTRIKFFLDHVIASSSKRPSQDVQRQLVDFLYQNLLLERIKKYQSDLDPDGVFKADLKSTMFLAAMTLRDCSLFLKVSKNQKSAIEVRVGDLDFKTPIGGKAEYWRSLERQLIDEGWYTATERNSATRENLCLLS